MKYLSSSLCFAFLLLVSLPVWAEIVVIGHADSEITVTDKDELANLYLGKRSELSGVRVNVLDQSEGSATRKRFYAEVANRSPAQLNAYWSKLIFTGKGMPPEQVGEDLEVIDRVQDDPDALGYVTAESIRGMKVKVLYRIP